MAVPFRVKAIHEYSSEHEDDLSFSLGQIITVTEVEDDDWYNGEYVDNQGLTREGIFPRNHVEKFEPTAPPRPTRTRPKRESEAPQTAPMEAAVASSSHAVRGEKHDDPQIEAHPGPQSESRPAAAAPITASSPKTSSDAGPASPDKPAVSSFKDRIAAFNKSNAPPILPGKPGVGRSDGSSFIKKPFVAPPPKRDAYVAPPRQTPVAQAPRPMGEAESRENPPLPTEVVDKSDQRYEDASPNEPAPTSLKERIAQLQRQRMEDQRNAEAAAKKEKPKKPPKKRTDPAVGMDTAPEVEQNSPSSDRRSMDNASTRTSTDDMRSARVPTLPGRRTSRGPGIDQVLDSNDADVSGAADAAEGPGDLTGREESDALHRSPTQRPSLSGNSHVVKTVDEEDLEASGEEEDEEVEHEVDPEFRRREELRARIQKTGGMGIPGLFHMSDFSASPKPMSAKPAAEEDTATEVSEEPSPIARGAPSIPVLSSIPSSSAYNAKQERKKSKSGDGPASPTRSVPPAGTASRPAPPPIPTDTRPPPPLPPPPPPAPPVDIKSQTEGSESDVESSAELRETPTPVAGSIAPPPAMPPHTPVSTRRSPPLSSRPEESSPSSPSKSASKRVSRPPPPPPVPGQAPTAPTPQSRPPPPPPPSTALSRQSTATSVGLAAPPTSRPPQAGDEDEEESTEYEADIDTDNQNQEASREVTKFHSRERDVDDGPLRTDARAAPASQPPPVPLPGPPRRQNSSHRSGESGLRRSLDAPVAAPPLPPQTRELFSGNLEATKDTSRAQTVTSAALGAGPGLRPERIEEGYPVGPAAADAKVPTGGTSGRAPQRPSMEATRTSTGNRRSMDVLRPSMESGFIANDIDLAYQSGWWQRADQLPPALQGRKDIHFEYEESASTNQGRKTMVTRETFVLYQDYSQTILTARYDPHNVSDVELCQRHEPPPRALRQDQMEEFHERFGLKILESAASKKDTVVGDGTPQGLVLELLRPLDDALRPVGARSYGALVYSNMANASTQQFDVIRAGDILSIRNAKFQGKHGPMHAKYSMEVGKPDHVAVVGEWDGTKKKVRAWEQGRENKKVKLESFKLDDLRSGEVKIWRVVSRSWVGWHR